MSSLLDRLRPDTSTSRTRLLMFGAVAGAVLALAISMAVASSQDGGTGGRPGGAGPEGGGLPSPDAEYGIKYAFAAPVGTCLSWKSDDGGDMRQVKCSEPHVFEVTQVLDVGKDYPAGAEQPGVSQWRDIAKERCGKGTETYLGHKLDPEGKLQLSALRPNAADWKRGNRELRCGLWRIGPGGSLQPTKGPAVEQDQSNIWATGTCLALAGKTVGDPVDCDRKHSYEMISVVDLGDEFDGYPSKKKQDAWLDKTCAKAAKAYTGGKDLEKLKLIVSWDTRTKASWAAGSELVNCKVGALLDDKSGLAGVTGSIAKSADKPTTKPSSKPSSKPSKKPSN